MNTFLTFLRRLFPKLFKQPVSKPVEAPTIDAVQPVATTLPSPAQIVPPAVVAVSGPMVVSTAPNVPNFGPLAPSQPAGIVLPRNGDELTPGTLHGFHPGNDGGFVVHVTEGKAIQIATSEGYGSGFVNLYDSAGNLIGHSQIANGYSSLYYLPHRSDDLRVEVVCTQFGGVAQQLGQQ